LPGVDIPTFKEQGVDVELVNWRGLMAPANIRPADKKALDDALGKMVKTAAWQALLKERGWVNAYLPSDRFAMFVEGEQARIAGLLKDLGLVQ
jgi:putative tricarboxylic transport membrane protein